MEISIYTVSLALFSMQKDIYFHERQAADPLLTDEERAEHGQYALDLTQAFGELRMIYQKLQPAYPEMQSVDELDAAVARVGKSYV